MTAGPVLPGPAPEPASLSGASVRLPGPLAGDPLDLAPEDGLVFASPDLVLVGWGTAAVLPLPGGLDDPGAVARLQDWLAAVPFHDDVGRPGSGLTALGSLPFDRRASGSLVVPEYLYGAHADGTCWVSVVAPAPGGPDPELLAALAAGTDVLPGPLRRDLPARPRPALADLAPHPAEAGYTRAVAGALELIARGTLEKVVVARSLHLSFDGPVAAAPVLRQLREQEPSCTVVALPAGEGRLLGASPELLVRRRGDRVTAQPLAGTAPTEPGAAGDRDPDGLLGSAKDRAEHRLVVEEIVRALAPRCRQLDVPDGPSLLKLRSLVHLGTVITGTLRGGDRGENRVLELLAVLHPTPAVGGVPRDEALAAIATLEPGSRDHWAGPVGWVDARGDGDWMIGIRSGLVHGHRAVLWAGAGIVAGSTPEAELAETTVKLAPVLEAFAPGRAPSAVRARGGARPGPGGVPPDGPGPIPGAAAPRR